MCHRVIREVKCDDCKTVTDPVIEYHLCEGQKRQGGQYGYNAFNNNERKVRYDSCSEKQPDEFPRVGRSIGKRECGCVALDNNLALAAENAAENFKMIEASVADYKALVQEFRSARRRAKKANEEHDAELRRTSEHLKHLESQLEQVGYDKEQFEQQIALLGSQQMLS